MFVFSKGPVNTHNAIMVDSLHAGLKLGSTTYKNYSKHDQKRTTTPITALKNGANYIVVGRDITLDKDPQGRVKQILENISY